MVPREARGVLPIAILAGGLGTRLLPTTQRLPKALVPVRGRPFIDHQLALLRSKGIARVVLCVSHLGEMIEKHVGNGSSHGLEVVYSYDGPNRIGTAGALKVALPQLGECFFTLYGDSYLLCDYSAIERTFVESGKSGLMTVYRNDNALAPSNVLFRDGMIFAYDKVQPTPQMQHIDYGLGVFNSHAFDNIPTDRTTDLAEVFRNLLGHGELAGYESTTRFYEVGTPAGIADLNAVLPAP